ncbi:hypothetical protein QA601_07560 [Chitinispirillales bacterium ANBcel5]|uniref:hypothetical protein n=1 Tax=Cellulosispirillum alkaliphilum TaxID=3039283 RepID=UPI002A55E1C1|nr:hypothetical protein [Chitinispirillales bacterium ANBcel5]
MRYRLSLCSLILLIAVVAKGSDVDMFLTPQLSANSVVSTSLGGAGSALSMGIMQGTINPALVFSYRSHVPERGALAVGYGYDSLYNDLLLPGGVSYANHEGALGFFYSIQRGTSGNLYEFTGNISGRLSEQVDSQGPVDYGLNIHYQNMSFSHELKDSASANIIKDMRERRLLFDLGFFQTNVMDNLDFSFVLKNLVGYRWSRTKEAYADEELADTLQDLNKSERNRGWTASRYRTMVVGIAYHFSLGQGVEISIPMDIEVFGLFDRKIKRTTVFRSGVQARVLSNYYLRFGFSRAPDSVPEVFSALRKGNLFFGGAGMIVNQLQLDFYRGSENWGLTASLDF